MAVYLGSQPVDITRKELIDSLTSLGLSILQGTIKRFSDSTITEIGQYAFYGCVQLSEISTPNVTVLHDYCFNQCKTLTSVYFSLVTSDIGSYTFQSCTALTTATLPQATKLPYCTFANCTHLTSVNVNKIESAGSSAFSYCTALPSILLPSASIIHNYAFRDCSVLTSISVPLVSSIGTAAFSNCQALTSIYLPSIKTIGNSAFQKCYNLISVNLTGISEVPSLKNSTVFSSTPIGGYSTSAGQYGSVYVPTSLYNSFLTATNWSLIASRIFSI